MFRLARISPAPLAAVLLAVGSGTLTAGVFDFLKPAAKSTRGVVARGQEPNPAPPAPPDVGSDPAYNPPQEQQPVPLTPAQAMPAQPCHGGYCGYDSAPQYSGFGGYIGGHVCTGCREPKSWCERCGFSLAKSSRRMHGDSYYCDCYPLFGPRYGYYDTCWRRLPEDCRCPIFLPPRKPTGVSNPIPTDGEEITPPPPQALYFR